MPEDLQKIRIEYWKSLGWEITQTLGLWNAEKSFPGFDEIFAIEGIETFEELDKLINTAEHENAKTTDDEQGLAVVEPKAPLGVFRGETVVNLDGEENQDSEVSEETANESGDFIDAETEDVPKKSKMSPPRVLENLKVILSDEEKTTRTAQLLQVMNTKDHKKLEFDSVRKTFNATDKDLDKEISRLRTVVDTGAEWRDVECEQKFDYGRGMVDLYRVDTGAFVRSRVMKQEERQAELFN